MVGAFVYHTNATTASLTEELKFFIDEKDSVEFLFPSDVIYKLTKPTV